MFRGGGGCLVKKDKVFLKKEIKVHLLTLHIITIYISKNSLPVKRRWNCKRQPGFYCSWQRYLHVYLLLKFSVNEFATNSYLNRYTSELLPIKSQWLNIYQNITTYHSALEFSMLLSVTPY